MKLYLENGYLDIKSIRDYMTKKNLVYCFIFGGRGIGKTYGALTDQLQRGKKFFMMRRTKTQIDLITNEKFSPFKAINKDQKSNIYPFSIGSGMYGFFNSVWDPDKKKWRKEGDEIGVVGAVSTSGNIRGYDGSDIDLILYDEFIPSPGERPIKGEAELLFNTIETIVRNRELEGETCQFLALSNSNNVDNPYFLELNLVNRALKMSQRKEDAVYEDKNKRLLIICINNSPISKRKKDTSLYQLTEGSSFERMAIDNDFVNIYQGSIKSLDLRHWKAVVALPGICLYKSTSDAKKWYVSAHSTRQVVFYGSEEISLARFRRKFAYLYNAYMNDTITFESHECEYLFTTYMKI